MTDPIDLSIRQFSGAWRVMCAPSPGFAAHTTDGLECIFTGLPVAFFNVGLVTGRNLSAPALQALGRAACDWAADKAVPWLFVVTNDGLQMGTDATAALDPCGLMPIMTLTGMAAEHVDPMTRVPDGLDLGVPRDDEGCAAMVDINTRAYAMDLEPSKAIIGKRGFWDGHAPVLGRVGGTPVSCAAVLMVDGVRYVALVATEPAQQRRGFAEAAMRLALDVAAREHGERTSVLHATEAGRPIYQRMGYRTISSHTICMEKRFFEGH